MARPAVMPGPSGARSIVDRITSCAIATPRRVAVRDALRRLTYEGLEWESDQLAARLRDIGAGPERCVGILLERSTGFVVAALATLKTGAAFVPVDPSTPFERMRVMLTDARAVCLVTSSRLASSLPEATWPLVALDSHRVADVRPFARPQIDAATLAYVVYTSGSTGRPKGVEVTHENLCNLIEWHQAAFAVASADRASQVAGLGFDAVSWEIWPYLTAGASVHIADEPTRRSPDMLRDWLVDQEITIAFVPTVLAEQLFREDWPERTQLRLLLTGGDTLHQRPPAGLPFAVINNYGPSECTVVATSGIVAPEGADTHIPSIGHPITNAIALILDDDLRQVTRGESGELCIGGALVARGYRNLPELTAERFVTYRAASIDPLRLYRTGDRARLLDSGEIEFLGRADDQVKIRGYRIELGEIEECLNRSPEILASAVTRVDDAGTGAALVAYVVLGDDADLTEPQLRERLAAHLADYMIPSVFVSIRSLPITSNGKLDKSALPAPCAKNALRAGPSTSADLSELEQQIGELVASLIGRPSIGANDNFFMIGGHSMFAAQFVARIRETFGVKLTLRDIFTAPTVRELTKEICHLRAAG
jgi:amino acid adenylation domain-containing protein